MATNLNSQNQFIQSEGPDSSDPQLRSAAKGTNELMISKSAIDPALSRSETDLQERICRIALSPSKDQIRFLSEQLTNSDIQIVEGALWALSRFERLPEEVAAAAIEVSRARRQEGGDVQPYIARFGLEIEAKASGSFEHLDRFLELELAPVSNVLPALIILARAGDNRVRDYLKRNARRSNVFPFLRDTIGLEFGDESLDQDLAKARKALHGKIPPDYDKESHISDLCEHREPVFASPYPESVTTTLMKLASVNAKMQAEFGERYLGAIVHGSLARGVLTPNSDVDYTLLYSDVGKGGFSYLHDDLGRRFMELCREEGLRPDGGRPIDTAHLDKEGQAELFKFGLFLGDEIRYSNLRATILEAIEEQDWNQIRKSHLLYLQSYRHKLEHFGFTIEDIETIQMVRRLRFSLPEVEEVRSTPSLEESTAKVR